MKILPRKPLPRDPVIRREQADIPESSLPSGLDDKLGLIKPYIEKSADIVCRNFTLGADSKVKAAVIYIASVIDKDLLNRDVLRSLMSSNFQSQNNESDPHISISDSMVILPASTRNAWPVLRLSCPQH